MHRPAHFFHHTHLKKEIDMTVTMSPNASGKGQRKTLSSQLDRLDDILDALSDGLNEAVGSAVEGAVATAVRDGVQLAVMEVLTNPELLRRVRAAAVLPEASAVPAPNHSGREAGLAAAASLAGGKAGDVFRQALAKGKELAGRCQAKARAVAASARSRLAVLGARLRQQGSMLGALALKFRKPLAVALGVGVAAGVACYCAGPLVSASVSAAGVFMASALGVVVYPFRRLFLPQPVPTS
jgi:hypothetical protein